MHKSFRAHLFLVKKELAFRQFLIITKFYFWRKRWDSNPRARVADNLISSQARYNHFDTLPKIYINLGCNDKKFNFSKAYFK